MISRKEFIQLSSRDSVLACQLVHTCMIAWACLPLGVFPDRDHPGFPWWLEGTLHLIKTITLLRVPGLLALKISFSGLCREKSVYEPRYTPSLQR